MIYQLKQSIPALSKKVLGKEKKKIKVMFGSHQILEKKIERKIWKKEKGKERKIIFFPCLIIHGKF